MPIFEVAVIEKPTQKEMENGAQEKLILAPKSVIAKDAQSAVLAAVMDGGIKVDLGRVEVIVRPFA